MDLESMMRRMAEREDDGPAISREGQFARVAEYGASYLAGNPHKVGDWVTPRDGGNTRGAGDPHMVVAVLAKPHVLWTQPGHASNGHVLDIRVACLMQGVVVTFWDEGHEYVPYTGPRA